MVVTSVTDVRPQPGRVVGRSGNQPAIGQHGERQNLTGLPGQSFQLTEAAVPSGESGCHRCGDELRAAGGHRSDNRRMLDRRCRRDVFDRELLRRFRSGEQPEIGIGTRVAICRWSLTARSNTAPVWPAKVCSTVRSPLSIAGPSCRRRR